jgi:hypothetical protein
MQLINCLSGGPATVTIKGNNSLTLIALLVGWRRRREAYYEDLLIHEQQL